MKKPAAKPEPKKAPLFAPNNQKSNLMIDQNSDLNMSLASQGIDDTTKDVLAAVAQSAQSLSESETSTLETDKLDKISSEIETKDKDEDLSVPKWPKYTDPASQKDEIQTELKEVKK